MPTTTTTTAYTVNAIDSESRSPWMDLCRTLRPGAQDSGRVLYHVTTDHAAALEAALDADDGVIQYRAD